MNIMPNIMAKTFQIPVVFSPTSGHLIRCLLHHRRPPGLTTTPRVLGTLGTNHGAARFLCGPFRCPPSRWASGLCLGVSRLYRKAHQKARQRRCSRQLLRSHGSLCRPCSAAWRHAPIVRITVGRRGGSQGVGHAPARGVGCWGIFGLAGRTVGATAVCLHPLRVSGPRGSAQYTATKCWVIAMKWREKWKVLVL